MQYPIYVRYAGVRWNGTGYTDIHSIGRSASSASLQSQRSEKDILRDLHVCALFDERTSIYSLEEFFSKLCTLNGGGQVILEYDEHLIPPQ